MKRVKITALQQELQCPVRIYRDVYGEKAIMLEVSMIICYNLTNRLTN